MLQNHVSILAKSLIISFQYNIESVYFFYSNLIYIYIYIYFYVLRRISKLLCGKKTVLQRETLAVLLCVCGPRTKNINPLNAELNPICHLLALLGAHHILNVSRIRVNTISQHQKPFINSYSVISV